MSRIAPLLLTPPGRILGHRQPKVNSEIVAVGLALGAAFSWGVSAVLVRKGLAYMSTAKGTLLSMIAGFGFTALLVVMFQLEEAKSVSTTALLLFALIGTLNFPFGRFFNFLSISRLGVARSTPILASSPLFAMLLAVLFTGETVNLTTFAGTALILAGLYVTLIAPRRPRGADAAGN